MRERFPWVLLVVVVLSGCADRAPGEEALRDSFAAQLEANEFVENVGREGDAITFVGPAAMGSGDGTWRIRIDSAVVEPNDDARFPYKGTVKSSWYSHEALVRPTGNQSNLPTELTSNGLAQECWALWNADAERWEWE